jgi:hypothetical protein
MVRTSSDFNLNLVCTTPPIYSHTTLERRYMVWGFPMYTFSIYIARQHPCTWSSTIPIAWRYAYTIVVPTKDIPRFLRSLDMLSDISDRVDICSISIGLFTITWLPVYIHSICIYVTNASVSEMLCIMILGLSYISIATTCRRYCLCNSTDMFHWESYTSLCIFRSLWHTMEPSPTTGYSFGWK